MVRNSVLHASLWKTMTMEAVGRWSWYCLKIHLLSEVDVKPLKRAIVQQTLYTVSLLCRPIIGQCAIKGYHIACHHIKLVLFESLQHFLLGDHNGSPHFTRAVGASMSGGDGRFPGAECAGRIIYGYDRRWSLIHYGWTAKYYQVGNGLKLNLFLRDSPKQSKHAGD